MPKRVRANWWIRIKSGKRAGYAAAAAAFTISATIIGLISATQSRVPWKVVIACLAITIIVFPIAAYVRGRAHLIPDFLIDEMSEDGQYSCEFCSYERLREACEMT